MYCARSSCRSSRLAVFVFSQLKKFSLLTFFSWNFSSLFFSSAEICSSAELSLFSTQQNFFSWRHENSFSQLRTFSLLKKFSLQLKKFESRIFSLHLCSAEKVLQLRIQFFSSARISSAEVCWQDFLSAEKFLYWRIFVQLRKFSSAHGIQTFSCEEWWFLQLSILLFSWKSRFLHKTFSAENMFPRCWRILQQNFDGFFTNSSQHWENFFTSQQDHMSAIRFCWEICWATLSEQLLSSKSWRSQTFLQQNFQTQIDFFSNIKFHEDDFWAQLKKFLSNENSLYSHVSWRKSFSKERKSLQPTLVGRRILNSPETVLSWAIFQHCKMRIWVLRKFAFLQTWEQIQILFTACQQRTCLKNADQDFVSSDHQLNDHAAGFSKSVQTKFQAKERIPRSYPWESHLHWLNF